ncbi:MAG: tyrosine-type recombinase/integrase [Ktedonobacterales bacterium]
MAGKRGNGEGSIRKRSDGRWEARITRDDGTPKSIYGKTRAQAAALMAAALRDQAQGVPIMRNERLTVAAFLRDWLPRHAARIEHSTASRYREFLELHIIPTLGKTTLTKLTAHDLERLYAAKLKTHSASTVRKVHLCLHLALEDALRKGLIARNVCDLATVPKPPRARFDVWTQDEATRFLAAVRGERLEALYVLALSVAMRQGELFALHWRDVDLDAGALYISGSLRRHTGLGRVVKAPKTATSRRRIRLPAHAVDALRRHKARQDEERLILGDEWDDHDLVFCNGIGRGLERQNVDAKDYYPLVAHAGVPRIRFHDLRHTCATLLLRAGVHPKKVSELLGHASIAITLDLYSHFLPDMQEETAAAMDAIFGSTGSTVTGLGHGLGQTEDETQAQEVLPLNISAFR